MLGWFTTLGATLRTLSGRKIEGFEARFAYLFARGLLFVCVLVGGHRSSLECCLHLILLGRRFLFSLSASSFSVKVKWHHLETITLTVVTVGGHRPLPFDTLAFVKKTLVKISGFKLGLFHACELLLVLNECFLA